MTNLLKDNRANQADWRAWALSIAIMILAGGAVFFSNTSVSMVREMRTELRQEIRDLRQNIEASARSVDERNRIQDSRIDSQERLCAEIKLKQDAVLRKVKPEL